MVRSKLTASRNFIASLIRKSDFRGKGTISNLLDRFFALSIRENPFEIIRLNSGPLIKLDLRHRIQRELFWYGEYDKLWIRLLFSFIQAGDTIFDVGANIGFYSIPLASRLSSGKIYAFEPFGVNFKRLNENISLNNFEKIIIPMCIVLGDSDDRRVELNPIPGWGDDKERETTNVIAVEIVSPYESVPAIKMEKVDTVMGKNNILECHVIKVDAEGWDLAVLKGASDCIDRNRPLIIVELNYEQMNQKKWTVKDLFSFLQPFGYFGFRVVNRKWVVAKEDMSPSEWGTENILFVSGQDQNRKIRNLMGL